MALEDLRLKSLPTHEFIHHSKVELTTLLSQLWWEILNKVGEGVSGACLICHQHNAGKTIKAISGQEPKQASRCFEDFKEILYKYSPQWF